MSDGIRVLSVVFGERLEIQFVDETLNSEDVIDVRNRVINPDLYQAEVRVVLELLTDIIDKADVHRRNPANEFRRAATPPLRNPDPPSDEG